MALLHINDGYIYAVDVENKLLIKYSIQMCLYTFERKTEKRRQRETILKGQFQESYTNSISCRQNDEVVSIYEM